MKAVIDASVIISAFVEKFQPSVDILTKLDVRYITPLTFLEVANATKSSGEDSDIISELIRKLHRDEFTVIDLKEDIVINAVTLAIQNNTSVYDASYHALAISLGVNFLTLDKKYYEKTKELGYVELVN